MAEVRRRDHRSGAVLVAGLATAAASMVGCAGLGQSARRPTSTTQAAATPAPRSQAAVAQATHEVPTPASPQRTDVSSRSAFQAVRAFAVSYINWEADTVAAQLTVLARESVGQARSAMELQAAQTAADTELKAGGIANHGTVQAIAPLVGSADRYVVVTREGTTATLTTAYAGLRPGWHVTVATVAQVGVRSWVVSGWQPES